MASEKPIHTLRAPRPVARPRTKPLAITVRRVGQVKSSGLSDHSGRQGRIMSITPRVAHRNTKNSTPMRRSHRRANEGERDETETAAGRLSSATLTGALANGSLESESRRA